MEDQLEDELKPCGALHFRYEDFAQDGRPLLRALPPSLGAVWEHQLWAHPGGAALRKAGIVPILTRIEINLTEDSFSPFFAGKVTGLGTLAPAIVPAGDHARVLVDVRAKVLAKTGHAMLPHENREEKLVGTMLGEHVLTRLFAEKDARRVTPDDVRALGIEIDGGREWHPPQSIVEVDPVKEALTPIDSDFVRDGTPLVFGLMHTDSNQHVNSLVYPHVFEEAVLRRLKMQKRDVRVLCRKLRIGYRKPSFLGETAHVEVRLFEQKSKIIAFCMLLADGESDRDRARVYARLELAP